MKTGLLTKFAAVFAIALASSLALAEEGQPASDGHKAKPAKFDRPDGGQFLEKAKELGLTEDQIAKIKQIFETHKQAVENFMKENGEKMKALREKFQAAKGDEEALKALKEEGKALMESHKALAEDLKKQLSEVLTAEQLEKFKAAFEKFRGEGGPGKGFGPGKGMGPMIGEKLGLTDEQKAKAKEIMEQARKDAKAAETPEAKKEIFEAAKKKFEDLLTDEQKKKLEEFKAAHPDAEGKFREKVKEHKRGGGAPAGTE
ncbi:MAG: Spy/CpxP family protein refolding chaperone [Planctomycetes bacterium]|nr:Spy/CpxP family protein refolding chaperone [Planctomycetota bacterium]